MQDNSTQDMSMRDEEICSFRCARAKLVHARGAIDNGRARESSDLSGRGTGGAAPSRDDFDSRRLRLPFQPDQMAVVQPRRSGVVASRARRDVGAQGTQFFRVGLVLSANATAQASMDG